MGLTGGATPRRCGGKPNWKKLLQNVGQYTLWDFFQPSKVKKEVKKEEVKKIGKHIVYSSVVTKVEAKPPRTFVKVSPASALKKQS